MRRRGAFALLILLAAVWSADAQIPFGSAVGAGVSSIVAGANITTSGSPNVTVNVAAALSGLTTIGLSGQLTSTLATGTAPFVVASTTNVVNLNASSLGGATFAAPGVIGGGTASSAAFTTVTGTSFQGIVGNVTPAAGTFTAVTANSYTNAAVHFAGLGAAAAGKLVYCDDCDAPAAGIMATCTSAGTKTGAWAHGVNTAVPVWGCIGI